MKYRYLLIILFFSTSSSANGMKIEISWLDKASSFSYFNSDSMYKDGDVYKIIEFNDITDGYYVVESKFLGLFSSNDKYEGKYQYSISLNKIKGGEFQLTGKKEFLSKKNKEVINSSKASLNKNFVLNDIPQCLDKDEENPTLRVCISYE